MKCSNKKKCGWGIFGLTALCAGAVAFVGLSGCSKSPERRAEWVTGKIASKLDLSKDQEAKLDEIKREYLAARARNGENRKAFFKDIEGLVGSNKLEESAVRGLMERKRAHIDSEFSNFFPKVQNFHASLSPEQKKKALDLIAKFKKRSGCCH